MAETVKPFFTELTSNRVDLAGCLLIKILIPTAYYYIFSVYTCKIQLNFPLLFSSALKNFITSPSTIRTVSKTSQPKFQHSPTALHQDITQFNSKETIFPHWCISQNKAIVTKCYQDFSQWDVESVSSMFKLQEEEQQKGLM